MKPLKLFLVLLIAASALYGLFRYLDKPDGSVTTVGAVANEPEQIPVAENEGDPPIWKWTDKQGVIHFVNNRRDIPEEYQKKATRMDLPALNIMDDESAKNLMLSGEKNIQIAKDRLNAPERVLLYTAPDCPRCRQAATLLNELNVAFVELDVQSDSRIMESMVKLTGGYNDVPVIAIGKRVIVGYKPHEIRKAVAGFDEKK